MTRTYELEAMFDSRKSFYRKAWVMVDGAVSRLRSYGVLVAEVDSGVVVLHPAWDTSQTTLRHVKEFLRQEGFTAETRGQMERDYVDCVAVAA